MMMVWFGAWWGDSFSPGFGVSRLEFSAFKGWLKPETVRALKPRTLDKGCPCRLW